MLAAFAAEQDDTILGNAKAFCQITQQVLIGLAINGCCGNADFDVIAMRANDFIPAGACLYAQAQEQVMTACLYRSL
jgi:hypothetical protein